MRTSRRWRLRHASLPEAKIGGEVVDGEGGGLLVGPMAGNGPEQVGISGDPLGECSPLDVAHHPASAAFFDSGEFASGDQRRRRRPGIATLSGHDVGEIQASGADADQRLSRLQGRFSGVLQNEGAWTGQAGDHQGFHGRKFSRMVPANLNESAFQTGLPKPVSSPPFAVRYILLALVY